MISLREIGDIKHVAVFALLLLLLSGPLIGCTGSRNQNPTAEKTPAPMPTKSIPILPKSTPTPVATVAPKGGNLSRIRIQERSFTLVTKNYDISVATEATFALGTRLSHRQDYEIEGVVSADEAQ